MSFRQAEFCCQHPVTQIADHSSRLPCDSLGKYLLPELILTNFMKLRQALNAGGVCSFSGSLSSFCRTVPLKDITWPGHQVSTCDCVYTDRVRAADGGVEAGRQMEGNLTYALLEHAVCSRPSVCGCQHFCSKSKSAVRLNMHCCATKWTMTLRRT